MADMKQSINSSDTLNKVLNIDSPIKSPPLILAYLSYSFILKSDIAVYLLLTITNYITTTLSDIIKYLLSSNAISNKSNSSSSQTPFP